MKSFVSFVLDEARKNPELNPKVSINSIIQQHYDDAPELSGTSTKNSFVSFTVIDKLGINPKSPYDTPIGVGYSYPSEYIIKKIGPNKPMSKLPFAGKSEFANVFSVSGNIVDLGKLSDSDLKGYYQKIGNIYADAMGAPGGGTEWKSAVDAVEKVILEAGKQAKFKTPGGKFWYVTMEVSKMLMSAPNWRSKSNHPVSWNVLFRKMGIDGFVDMGKGIIHTAEPTQAFFLSKEVIKNVKRYFNKYSPDSVNPGVGLGQTLKQVKLFKALTEKETIERIEAMIANGDEEYVIELAFGQNTNVTVLKTILKKYGNKMPKDDLTRLFWAKPMSIQWIPNPSEEISALAISIDAWAIEKIQNPSEKLQLKAVSKDPEVLKFLPDPSEKIQLAALEKNPVFIYSIKKPTPKAIEYAKAQGVVDL